MPFGKYKTFDTCVKANRDKRSPGGYCAVTHKKTTGKWPGKKQKGGNKMPTRKRKSPKRVAAGKKAARTRKRNAAKRKRR